jgi:hypothetical protein
MLDTAALAALRALGPDALISWGAQRGLVLQAGSILADPAWLGDVTVAMDAQPTLFTQPNAGVPAWLSTLIDPEVIRILFAPMRATEIYPEVKKGDWTTTAAEFPTIEPTGFVTSYGDWNNNGNVGANVNWTPRQSYYYQTVQQYGEREIDRMGLARINYVAELDRSAAFTMAKFQNASYIYGVSGLINYGMINDPSLPAAIQPTLKQAGGYLWTAPATSTEIYNDFLKLFSQLQTQLGGLLKQTDRIRVVLSPGRAILLNTVNAFNITPLASIRLGFPSIEFVQVPEYSTTGGELMQMIADSIDGTETGQTAYTEKMRAHPVIPDLSGWAQKKSGGTWGAIIRRPVCVAQMLGI